MYEGSLAVFPDPVVSQDPASSPVPAANSVPAADHVDRVQVAVRHAGPPAVGYSPKHAAARGVSPAWILPGSPGWHPILAELAAAG